LKKNFILKRLTTAGVPEIRQSYLLLSLIKFNALGKSDGVIPEFFLVLRKISPLPKEIGVSLIQVLQRLLKNLTVTLF
ncbi:hypothetical protein, partial [Parasutterella excrementihominis]|uniref:hypothetical protein n=1 Tax=Parasutterella excrementihominis TaxID=487175 RepID=UPI0026659059